MAIATINPATGETLRTFEPLTEDQVDQRLGTARAAFASYRETDFAARAAWMRALAEGLDRGTEKLARMMTTEMGKTVVAARAEVAKCATACRFYADHAAKFLAEEEIEPHRVGARRAFVAYEPLGPILAVMPWNFPLWQVIRFAAPALMAGNVGLLKHAPNVPQTALMLESLVAEAGFAEGVLQVLLIEAGQVGPVLDDPRVAAATLTGSGAAGRSVAAIAGRSLKKTVLELGGSDPFIVLPSADLAEAARVAAVSRCQNNGQSCIAAKRFIVHEQVASEFEQLMVEAMRDLNVGDPMDESTDVGPLATEGGRENLDGMVREAVAKGAEILCGGHPADGPGWYFPPSVVRGVTPDMRMHAEEVFGPVAPIYQVDTFDEAITLANSTMFGLGSNVWTNEPEEQDEAIRGLEAGAVCVNGMTTSYPDLPFDGVKQSGYGRELSSHGMREFCNAKSIWIGHVRPQATA